MMKLFLHVVRIVQLNFIHVIKRHVRSKYIINNLKGKLSPYPLRGERGDWKEPLHGGVGFYVKP